MKNILLLSFCLLTVSCVSVKFPETLSVNVELDKESAKNLSEAIKNSNYKTIMMAHHKEKGMKMTDEDNITLEFASELPIMADEKNIILEFIEDASKKLDKFEKNKEFSNKISQGYRKLAKKKGWKVVNASQSKDEVHKDVMKIVAKKMGL